MNFSQFILILKARFQIILITLFVIVAATLTINLLLPKSFTATTSLVLNYKGMDPVTGIVLPAQLMPGYMATQIDIITSRNVAIKVVDQLKFIESPLAQAQFQEATEGKGDIRAWFADKLLKGLNVKPSRESSVLEISFDGADPDFASSVANAFANAYIQTSLQLKVEPAQKAAKFLDEQTKTLRANLETAQSRMSKYQQEKGLTNMMGSLDVENARLNDLSSQLVMAQSQAYESTFRQQSASGNAQSSPDIAANPVVQNLKVSISHAESKLSELTQRVGVSHPQYLAAKAELDKLRGLLQQETRNVSSSIGGTARIYQQREAELKAALAEQKARVLTLNLSRDELAVLQRDVENAQHAMDAASQRFTQATIEGNANQTDVAVLNPAIPPQSPAGPKILLNVFLSIILGTMIAFLFALLAEMLDRRVRSRDDLSDLLEVPVFAIIKGGPAKNSGRLSKLSPRLLKGV
ncbi:MAG: chain length determinant protein EpsF [Methylotenera sp.]|nr:chain length determinant protein EpsF [Methylotenera sp.]